MRKFRRVALEENKRTNNDRWLLTYSDMITLLLALFIIMYGMSSLDAGKFQNMTSELARALSPASSEVQELTGFPVQKNSLDEIYQDLKQYVDTNNMNEQIELVQSPTAVSIHLKDTILFVPGTSELLPASEPVLNEISALIAGIYNNINHITITGNTADLGNRDSENELDSWQLSVDRAVQVLNSMTKSGASPEKFSIEGNSHYNPLASNNTQEGRTKNRRVEITITNEAN